MDVNKIKKWLAMHFWKFTLVAIVITLILHFLGVFNAAQAQTPWDERSIPMSFPAVEARDSLVVGDGSMKVDSSGFLETQGPVYLEKRLFLSINDTANGLYVNEKSRKIRGYNTDPFYNLLDSVSFPGSLLPSDISTGNSSGALRIKGGGNPGGVIYLSAGGNTSNKDGLYENGSIVFFAGRRVDTTYSYLVNHPKQRAYITPKGTFVISDTVPVKFTRNIEYYGELDTSLSMYVDGDAYIKGAFTSEIQFLKNFIDANDISLQNGEILQSDGTQMNAAEVVNPRVQSASLDFGNLGISQSEDLNINVSCQEGDAFVVSPPAELASYPDVQLTYYISAANTVTIRASYVGDNTGGVDMPPLTYTVTVLENPDP